MPMCLVAYLRNSLLSIVFIFRVSNLVIKVGFEPYFLTKKNPERIQDFFKSMIKRYLIKSMKEASFMILMNSRSLLAFSLSALFLEIAVFNFATTTSALAPLRASMMALR